MNIKKFSKITGLTDHTLRYYEKIGLLKNIKRNSIGYRDYSEKDILWVEFLERLKNTGMPIKDMIKFAELRYKGERTIKERLKLLENHKILIQNNIKKLSNNLKQIIKKIDFYKNY
jgi:DNA-binding transcriptional MerR regulator